MPRPFWVLSTAWVYLNEPTNWVPVKVRGAYGILLILSLRVEGYDQVEPSLREKPFRLLDLDKNNRADPIPLGQLNGKVQVLNVCLPT